MIRALWTASTGMYGQQLNVDTIAHNLANVTTMGFKKVRVNFQDLMYQTIRPAGATSLLGIQIPTALDVGHGVRPAATQRLFMPGSFLHTGNKFDLAIEGEGFFQVRLPDNTLAYTRDGTFRVDGQGRLVTADGHFLVMGATGGGGAVVIPANAVEVTIAEDGTISVLIAGESTPRQLGQIRLARFVNPSGLSAQGRNLLKQTVASGQPSVRRPGEAGTGTIVQGYLETSNVQVVEEMVNLIVAQRAYEVSSRAVQTADDMLGMANALRR